MGITSPFLGILLGAIPGVHQNLISLLPLTSLDLFITVLASIFSSVIPALLMAPAPEMVAILLPGQDLVRKGKIGRAVSEFLGGALLGTALFIILLPLYPYLTIIPQLFSRIFWLPLIGFALVPIVRSKRQWKWSLAFFLISGVYGWAILQLPYRTEAILMAHFGGMFGLSGLLIAGKMVKQKIKPPRVAFNFASSIIGTLGGLLISLFPALTPAQASAFVFALSGKPESQIASAGALSTSAFLFCFLSLRFLGKPRSAAVQRIGDLHLNSILLVAALSYLVVMLLVPTICKLLSKWDLRKLLAIFLIGMIGVVSGSAGWIALPSLGLGYWCKKKGVPTVNLMGSLMFPTILWYLMH
ncbi:MAG: hypothetical protein GOV00_00025 [Candidatus Altiarchaeota archaeon]|nr:hypothetical protein [Candidatus Altiarchaeota archaeon]